MRSSWSEQATIPLSYFLWYLDDQKYNYVISHEEAQICDMMEGWCSQCFKIITIQLKAGG